MFDKIKGLFEIFSQSSIKHKDKTLRSITVKMGASYLANKIIDILKSLKILDFVVITGDLFDNKLSLNSEHTKHIFITYIPKDKKWNQQKK